MLLVLSLKKKKARRYFNKSDEKTDYLKMALYGHTCISNPPYFRYSLYAGVVYKDF